MSSAMPTRQVSMPWIHLQPMFWVWITVPQVFMIRSLVFKISPVRALWWRLVWPVRDQVTPQLSWVDNRLLQVIFQLLRVMWHKPRIRVRLLWVIRLLHRATAQSQSVRPQLVRMPFMLRALKLWHQETLPLRWVSRPRPQLFTR